MSPSEVLEQPPQTDATAAPPLAYDFSPEDVEALCREGWRPGMAITGVLLTVFGLALAGYVVVMLCVAG